MPLPLALDWTDLGLEPGFEVGPLLIRYYALAYLVGILGGVWHLRRMVRPSGSPFDERVVDDFLLAAVLGIVVGGRLGYATFYDPELWTSWRLVAVWEGGMSFHGGVIGVLLAIGWTTWRHGVWFRRLGDYVCVNLPLGIGLGRIANFVNGELWGRPTDVPWAVVFPGAGPAPRHPSQLYEAVLEGLVIGAAMLWMFWRTRARRHPGLLAGTWLAAYGVARFGVEFVREPDAQLRGFAEATGLHMGQWLCVPMIVAGLVLVLRSRRVDARADAPA